MLFQKHGEGSVVLAVIGRFEAVLEGEDAMLRRSCEVEIGA
jgi:hypothetical protein